MASTGTAFFPSTTSYPNTTQYPGQGTLSLYRCRLSFDDASDSTPNWVEITNLDFRDFTTSRGRDSEQAAHDAGTATVVLDNRDRAFDPTNTAGPYYPNITPMAQVWLYEEFSGEVHDLFRGYVESWDQEWPGGGWSDAIVTLTCSDEFKVLALAGLLLTDPPRSSYEEVVAFDNPAGLWRLNDDVTKLQASLPSITEPNAEPPTEDTPIPQVFNPFLRKAFYRNPNPKRRAFPKK